MVIRTGLLLLALSLTGCGGGLLGGGEDKVPLTGKRVDIIVRKTALVAETEALQSPLKLPVPFENENWSQVGGNSAHAIGHVGLPAEVQYAWKRSVGSSGTGDRRFLNPPVINAGRLFAVNTEGEVMALNATNGEVLWRQALPLTEEEHEGFAGGVAVTGDLLFVTAATGQVFAFSASEGSLIWQVDLAVPLRAAPAVRGERVFIVSRDNRLFVLSGLDGSLQWTHSAISESLAMLGGAAPAVTEDVVVIPYTSGEIYVLNVTDGRYVWHTALVPSIGGDPFAGLVDVAAMPVVADGIIYAVNINGRLSAYEVATGRRFWTRDLGTTQTPWVVGTALYVLTDEGELAALNRIDGKVRWIVDLNQYFEENPNRYWSGPILAGKRLIAAASDGFAISLDPFTGKKLLAAELLSSDGASVPPIAAGNGLYFLTDKGNIIAFR